MNYLDYLSQTPPELLTRGEIKFDELFTFGRFFKISTPPCDPSKMTSLTFNDGVKSLDFLHFLTEFKA